MKEKMPLDVCMSGGIFGFQPKLMAYGLWLMIL